MSDAAFAELVPQVCIRECRDDDASGLALGTAPFITNGKQLWQSQEIAVFTMDTVFVPLVLLGVLRYLPALFLNGRAEARYGMVLLVVLNLAADGVAHVKIRKAGGTAMGNIHTE